jgi:hypothetical protein
MAKFVYIYTGGSGMPDTEEARNEAMTKWQAFLGGFGDDLVDIGAPFGPSQSVSGNGAGTKATGYSVVSAASLEDAVTRAKACPVFERPNGNVEVYEALEM